jgi:hypothetical protein
MTDPTRQLEDALRAFNSAEVYFENAYLTYRLASRYLDEAEADVVAARDNIDPLVQEPLGTEDA